MTKKLNRQSMYFCGSLSMASVLIACSGGGGGNEQVIVDPTPTLTVQQQCEIDTFDNAPSNPAISIDWQQDSIQFVSDGVYSRVKKLADGRLIIVYSQGPNAVYRISTDNGQTWGEQLIAAHGGDFYNYTNSEFIELQNGSWVYAWNARPKTENGAENFQIKLSLSHDKGQTWQTEQLIFDAANMFNQGTWEPAFLQLPSGELQIYFANEFPYGGDNNDQEISMKRSYDNGINWESLETLSFRQGSRDGMPVPILLNDQSDIVFAIEDNGLAGDFKPVTIRSPLTQNWVQDRVEANSPYRERALRSDAQLDNGIYAGAPYLAQLPSGETLLSVQSSQCRKNKLAYLRVYIGDDKARNFAYPSTPFSTDFVQADVEVLWNGITVLDNNTLMATSSINTGDSKPNGIYIVKGTIVRQ
jgi:hypothetical protein